MRSKAVVLAALIAGACAGPKPAAPPSGDSLIRQGDGYFRRKDYARALARYDEAIKAVPDDAEAWGRRGKVLLHLGKLDESIANSRQALKLDAAVRDRDEVHRYIGSVLLLQKGPTEALPEFDAAMRENPLNYEALSARAMALLQLGLWEQAQEDLDRALVIRPNFAEAQRRLATIAGLRRMKAAGLRRYWSDWREAVLSRGAAP